MAAGCAPAPEASALPVTKGCETVCEVVQIVVVAVEDRGRAEVVGPVLSQEVRGCS